MAKRVQSWITDRVASNLKLPQKTVIGQMTARMFLKKNVYMEENAVRLCNIKPDYKVLELGFGPGYGLKSAYNKVRDGKGKVYGIDTSLFMVDMAGKRLRKEVDKKKVLLFHGTAAHIPLNTDSIHRVFHCNCYYFWPNMRVVMREIYRVMKPGGVMITVLSMERLKWAESNGFLKYGKSDPVKYMTCLENYGFEDVRIEYMNDPKSGAPFQAIFAEINEKPAHHADLLSDSDDEAPASETLKKDG